MYYLPLFVLARSEMVVLVDPPPSTTAQRFLRASPNSQDIRFEQNGKITGAVRGTWERVGDTGVTLTVDGTQYKGGFVCQWNPKSQDYVLTSAIPAV
jgi:hypothetical protein